MKDVIQAQFGANAGAYVTSDVHVSGESLSALADVLSGRKHGCALDIATGAGHTAIAVAPFVREVVASDFTAEMLAETRALAAKRGVTNLTTAFADAEQLPFGPDEFDLVTCRLAAHHFADVAAFVGEARRVLRAGGILAVIDNVSPDDVLLPGLDGASLEAAGEAYNSFEKLRDPGHGRALRVHEWGQLIAETGFAILSLRRFRKELDFQEYVDRLQCPPEAVAILHERLSAGDPHLKTFLDPQMRQGRLKFNLHEVLLVAQKAC